ncbi:hypothetical protein EJ02DRAFT_21768 [Clathrospora elynae]|uniref:Uncharacterized protein n=1 Tax=Clathrospora elynae TaxID=706981 RepID=A0A6A5SF18_9PLEO|nr:hypothetical protein EJ02DRAFT_21768 [Clathrospora elynae]
MFFSNSTMRLEAVLPLGVSEPTLRDDFVPCCHASYVPNLSTPKIVAVLQGTKSELRDVLVEIRAELSTTRGPRGRAATMVTRLERERREERERAESITMICVVLMPSNDCFPIPDKHLKEEECDFANNILASSLLQQQPVVYRKNFDPNIFRFFALYCLRLSLFSNADLPRPYTTYEESIPNFTETVPSTYTPKITMITLSDPRLDHDKAKIRPARQLLHAYIMAQSMGAKHFQDAIMNAIVKFFRVDGFPLPAFVFDVYRRCAPGPCGLKKLIVDYYIWIDSTEHRKALPPLHTYLREFGQDATEVFAAIKTFMVIDRRDPLQRQESLDVVVNFNKLETFLRDERGARLRCRYHEHTRHQMCFSLIVDDTSIAHRAGAALW